MYPAPPVNRKSRVVDNPSAEYEAEDPNGSGEGTYDYDGRPDNPVPKVDPKRQTDPEMRRKVNGERRDVSLRRRPGKWAYRAYGP
jgi:hypothetical protein